MSHQKMERMLTTVQVHLLQFHSNFDLPCCIEQDNGENDDEEIDLDESIKIIERYMNNNPKPMNTQELGEEIREVDSESSIETPKNNRFSNVENEDENEEEGEPPIIRR